MKNTELLQNAIGLIGDDLIDDADRKPRRPRVIRWSAVACACLAVIICLSAILGDPKTPIEPWIPTGEPWRPVIGDNIQEMNLKADTLKGLFAQRLEGGTNAYTKVYAPTVQLLASTPIPQADYLPIYKTTDSNGNRAALEAFIETYLVAAHELYGFGVSDYTIEETERSDGTVSYIARLEQSDGADLTFQSYGNILRFYNWPSYKEKRFHFNDSFISLLESDTDEQIKEKLSSFVLYLNETLGKNYSDIKIKKTYDYSSLSKVLIYLYDAQEGAFPENFRSAPMSSEYIELEFEVASGTGTSNNWDGNKNEAFLTQIFYYENLDFENEYTATGKSRMLTLDEAEELLAKGYVFGGHSCKLCMAAQDKVDFTEYDAVSFQYVHGDNGMIIPFYVFYKHLGVSEYDKTGRIQEYAKTYVPAVEIEGLEEYFDMQTEKHK